MLKASKPLGNYQVAGAGMGRSLRHDDNDRQLYFNLSGSGTTNRNKRTGITPDEQYIDDLIELLSALKQMQGNEALP